MRRLGVSDGRPVVVYDDAGSTVAARAWWALRYFGHQDVRVLDGGLPAWTGAGLPTTKDSPDLAASGDFTARPGGMPALTADEAAALATQGVLLDARAAERYRGEVEPVDPVAGHVPGPSAPPRRRTSGPTAASSRPPPSGTASPGWGSGRGSRQAPTAAPA